MKKVMLLIIACVILLAGCNKKAENQIETAQPVENLAAIEESANSSQETDVVPESSNSDPLEENSITEQKAKLIKIAEFQNNPNDTETISSRSAFGDDDISGNKILISSEGEILIHCRDKNEVFYFDDESKKLYPLFDTKFLPASNFADFIQITKNHYFFFGSVGNFYLVDKDNTLKVSLSFLYDWDIDWDILPHFYSAMYDEDTDTLFFIDGKKAIYSIEHPSLDKNENQKNYRGSSETMTKLEFDEYAPHLTIDKKNNLYIDGVKHHWGYNFDYDVYETKDYIISLISDDYYINVYDRTQREKLYYTIPENEEVESSTYHPNGDWYFLTINWSTNTHSLWRIENTWDPAWREQWNK